MRKGNWVVVVALALASLGMLCIGALMNFRFGSSFGRTEFDGWLFGGVSALADVVKAATPFAVDYARRRGCWIQAIAGVTVCVICMSYSFVGTTGFGIVSRTYAADAGAIQAGLNRNALAALQSDQIELTQVQGELSNANLRGRDRQDLLQREATLLRGTTELRSHLTMAPSILTPTSQAEALAKMVGIDPALTLNCLVVQLAVFLELCTSLGLFLAIGVLGDESKDKSALTLLEKLKTRAGMTVGLTARSHYQPIGVPCLTFQMTSFMQLRAISHAAGQITFIGPPPL
jgi:hypothetical protein